METSIFLAKVIGIYLAIEGLSLLINKKYIVKSVKGLLTSKGTIYVFSFFVLLLGIILVVSHNIWTSDWRGVITVIGWLVLIKGAVNALFPRIGTAAAEKFAPTKWYGITGLFFIVVGAYLAAKGFGWM
ncbi:hypothetical protein CL635_03320 [bacterium]|nr:hypothetical protein [bacterium]|tara:strand:- start:1370 stop:1756 length:387 start_codon:yes stop_codon:yes gene_type:complete